MINAKWLLLIIPVWSILCFALMAAGVAVSDSNKREERTKRKLKEIEGIRESIIDEFVEHGNCTHDYDSGSPSYPGHDDVSYAEKKAETFKNLYLARCSDINVTPIGIDVSKVKMVKINWDHIDDTESKIV